MGLFDWFKPSISVRASRRLVGHDGKVTCLAFTRDSRTLISAEHGYQAKLILWDLPDGRVIRTHDASNWEGKFCISDDGMTLAVRGSKRVYTYRLPLCDPLVDVDTHGESISVIALSPDGKLLATGASYTAVNPKLWSLPEGKLLHTLPKAVQTRNLRFSSDSRLLAVAATDELVSFWSVAHGTQVRTLTKEVTGDYADSFYFSPDGEILVFGHGSNQIRFVQVASGQLLSKSEAMTFHYQLAFSPDGSLVACSGESGSAIVWDLRSGQQVCELPGHTEGGLHLALSDQPRILVSSSTHQRSKKDHTVRLWSIPNGKRIAVLKGFSPPPHAVAISPDGRFVAIAPDNEPLRLLELKIPPSLQIEKKKPSPERIAKANIGATSALARQFATQPKVQCDERLNVHEGVQFWRSDCLAETRKYEQSLPGDPLQRATADFAIKDAFGSTIRPPLRIAFVFPRDEKIVQLGIDNSAYHEVRIWKDGIALIHHHIIGSVKSRAEELKGQGCFAFCVVAGGPADQWKVNETSTELRAIGLNEH